MSTSRASSAHSVAWQALCTLNVLLRGAGPQLFEQGGQRAVLVDDRIHVRVLLRERDVLLLQAFDLLHRRLAAARLPRGSELLARLVALRGQLLNKSQQLLDAAQRAHGRARRLRSNSHGCAGGHAQRSGGLGRGPRGCQAGGQQWHERHSPPRHFATCGATSELLRRARGSTVHRRGRHPQPLNHWPPKAHDGLAHHGGACRRARGRARRVGSGWKRRARSAGCGGAQGERHVRREARRQAGGNSHLLRRRTSSLRPPAPRMARPARAPLATSSREGVACHAGHRGLSEPRLPRRHYSPRGRGPLPRGLSAEGRSVRQAALSSAGGPFLTVGGTKQALRVRRRSGRRPARRRPGAARCYPSRVGRGSSCPLPARARRRSKIGGQFAIQLGERVAIKTLQAERRHNPVPVRRAESARVGAQVQHTQGGQLFEHGQCRVERYHKIAEQRQLLQSHARGEGRDGADLVAGSEELLEQRAIRKRLERSDAVEIDVECGEPAHARAASEGVNVVVGQ
eukprot:scaffold6033_cov63-Phaeocystis_antarctica.AAC.5